MPQTLWLALETMPDCDPYGNHHHHVRPVKAQALSSSEKQQDLKSSSISCSVWLPSLVEKKKKVTENPLGMPRFYQDSGVQG